MAIHGDDYKELEEALVEFATILKPQSSSDAMELERCGMIRVSKLGYETIQEENARLRQECEKWKRASGRA